MIEVHLYGSLRQYAPDPRLDRESVVRIKAQPGETVQTALQRLGIPAAHICHVFLNGALLSTANSMAPWLKYRQVDGGLGTALEAGDRLGLFAHDMALLVV